MVAVHGIEPSLPLSESGVQTLTLCGNKMVVPPGIEPG